MTTPERRQIYEEAKRLWFQHEARSGNLAVINPTYGELLESGFISVAQSNLMSNLPSNVVVIEKKSKSKREMKATQFEVNIGEALKSGIYTCGTTGSGKSDVAMYIADLLKPVATIYVVDPSQDWINRSNIPNVITVPQNLRTKVYDAHTIYDTSRLRRPDKRAFAETLTQTLMDYAVNQPQDQRKNRFVIFEEAQLIFPEGSFRGRKYNACVELVSMGRNYGLRFMAITPFSANVDKMLVKITKQRYFGWSNEKNDLKYLAGFLGKQVDELKKLKAGQFLYHNPSQGTLKKIKIRPHKRKMSLKKLQVRHDNYTQSQMRQPTNKLRDFGLVLMVLWSLMALFSMAV